MLFHNQKRLLRTAVLFSSIYFVYHLINGNRGLVAWVQTRHKIQQNEVKLKRMIDEKEKYSHLVNLLKPGKNVDKDLLEERARILLGYVYKEDKIIILDKK